MKGYSGCKKPKGLTDAFYGCEKSKKRFCFWDLFRLKDSGFTAV